MPSLSVILPTLNCMPLLPAHIASMRPWLDLADEIIVVDSFSNDGTVEYLQRELAGLPVQFHNRPRGLYQAWNFGIQQAAHHWLYISTVGDSISSDLLRHLIALGEATQADLVLSRPSCVFDPGLDGEPIRWAIHDILETAAPRNDFLLSHAAAHFFALIHAHTSALLGSSASNLYRTAQLQKYPFPTEYGTAGDCAWGLLHALHCRVACTAHEGSVFRIHAKSYTAADYQIDQLFERLQTLGLEIHRQANRPELLAPLLLPEILASRDELASRYNELKLMRKANRFWFLHGKIWTTRRETKRLRKQLKSHQGAAYTRIRQTHITPIALGTATDALASTS